MLDPHFKIFCVEATFAKKTESHISALLLKACNVNAFSEKNIYSELDEISYDELNHNSFDCGALDIEFILENRITQEPYPDFYTKCFVIRTDTSLRIKPMKLSNSSCISRVNQNGELVIGIRYYFRDKEEIDQLKKSNSILVEGFIALQNPKNVYGLMCQLSKDEGLWKLISAYTYKPHYAKNIKYLID